MKEREKELRAMEGNYFVPAKSQPDSYEYTFQVVLKDSSKTEVYSRIYMDTAAGKTYLLVIDNKFSKSDPSHRERKIYADQTISITRIASSGYLNHPVEVKGMATDSCWMFKAIKGSVTAYSYLSEYDDRANDHFDSEAIIAIQLNEGPIVQYSEKNLTQMVGQDARALEIIQNKNYYRAIKRFNKDTPTIEKK
ncbi:MAG TPA: hypothetical protein VFE53_23120 [Mucilaginibacter sp.]|nr:hypothetical protein [Mucilaginibacter sp.]